MVTTKTKVLISGASIAGPALAYWLHRFGASVAVVERAPALRQGGQAVDFRGEAHLRVLRRMGLLDAVRARQTNMGDLALIDACGATVTRLPAAFMSGDVEILRGDLSTLLYDATRATTEYRFGDRITSLDDTPDGVDVQFAHAAPERFDLVLGADGLHSGVRALTFGDEGRFLRHLGYYAAGFALPIGGGDDDGDDDGRRRGTTRVYSEPGRAVSVSIPRDRSVAGRALFVFKSERLTFARPDIDVQKDIVRRTFAGCGWETARFLNAMESASDLYFDAVARIDLERVSKGRVALVGDAAFGATLGGQGTGGALIGAYVLAGELAAANGDHRAAFAAYEARIRSYAVGCQSGANHVGPFYAPGSRVGLWWRNVMYKLLASPALSSVLERLVRSSASGIALMDYAAASSNT